jgi:hypothetical protein
MVEVALFYRQFICVCIKLKNAKSLQVINVSFFDICAYRGKKRGKKESAGNDTQKNVS